MRLSVLLGFVATLAVASAACSDSSTSGDGGTSGTGGSAGSGGTAGTSATGDSGTSGTAGTAGTSGDSGTSGTAGTAGTSGDGGTTTDAAADSGTADVRCTTFDDKTSLTTVPVTWNLQVEITGSANCCVKVKAGTKVSLAGNFSAHPVEANGGTTPNPFTGLTMPTTGNLDVTLSTAGTYGYKCSVHTTSMRCAVQVVP